MSESDSQIMSGTIIGTSDNFVLSLPHALLDVSLPGPLEIQFDDLHESLDRQRVSILGRMGVRDVAGTSIPSFIASKIIRQDAIERRAFAIWEAEGGPALDNWLCAERELLGI